MFYTGQASNPLAAKMAGQAGFDVTWTSWLVAGAVPGLLSLAIIPLVVLRLSPPKIRRTPEAPAFAAAELAKMGPMSVQEKTMLAVFLIVCGAWVTSGIHKIDITVTALMGSIILILTGTLSWEDVRCEKAAWDIFVWYGGIIRLGRALNDTGLTTLFARWVASLFSGSNWILLFAGALLIYYFAHYGFASITAHLLAMYPPFLAVLAAKGAPIGLMVYSFACFANLAAGLTNYGTTPSPIYFGQDYVTWRDWWKIGFVIALVNLTIWSVAGFSWWKLLGIW
jgi:DASS family divalent anion:Na+ symporter